LLVAQGGKRPRSVDGEEEGEERDNGRPTSCHGSRRQRVEQQSWESLGDQQEHQQQGQQGGGGDTSAGGEAAPEDGAAAAGGGGGGGGGGESFVRVH
jgi:hypothetical protein